MDAPPKLPKRDRVVFTTAERLAQRGVRAHATSWGWSWIAASDGTLALYVSAGVPERYGQHRKKAPPSPKARTNKPAPPPGIPHTMLQKPYTVLRCEKCGYTESTLITDADPADRPRSAHKLCLSCMEDSCAIHALELQAAWGINLGWRRPELGVMQRDFHEDESGLSLRAPSFLRSQAWRARKQREQPSCA